MTRNNRNPAYSLGQFMMGIYDYYHDRGMPQTTAKARMIDNTMEKVTDFVGKEKDIPDHMLVIMSQFLSKALDKRGADIAKAIQSKYSQGSTVPENELAALRDLKPLKDELETFIQNYKGWSETNGEDKN